MQTVIHPFYHRPWVKDDGPNIGYEGRVVYALGLVEAHYPVPALLDHEPMVAMARAHWYIQSEPCTWD